VLWNVYSFFVTYARLAGWEPTSGIDEAIGAGRARGPRSIAGSCPRSAGAAEVGARLGDYDPVGATRATTFIETSRPGTCAAPGIAARRRRPAIGMRRSRRSTRRS
jgi:hypothetical protein